jgi:hypothetical protein
MVSAVLMAGYSKPTEDYKRLVRDSYGEHFFYEGYKPLKEFRARIDSKNFISKPLIQFTMEKLEGVDSIDDVVVVGDREKLESRLGSFMDQSKKKYIIVEQEGHLSDRVLSEFSADRSNFPESSIAANGLKAYIYSKSYIEHDYALFIASDSPETSTETIGDFIAQAESYAPKSSVIFPLTSKKNLPSWRHCIHRKYIFFVNDTEHQFKDKFSTYSSIACNKLFRKATRDGFRVSSMMYVDPPRVNIDRINLCYDVRKMFDAEVRAKIHKILKENNAGHIWKKYFISKNLSIRDCEKFCSDFLCREGSKVTVLPLSDVASSFDFDGTEEDQKMLEKDLMRGE